MTPILQNGWPVKRLRFVTRQSISPEQRQKLSEATQITFLPMEAIGDRGELDLSIVRDIDDVRTGYTQFFDGDVVIAKITPCFENGKGALISGILNGVGYGTTELHVLSPDSELDGRFLYYITVSEPFRKLGEAGMTGAAGQKRVPEDFVRDFRIPLPSLHQQRAIVDFLNCETTRLDGLMLEKERLLDLLAEKRRALITHAVTRGLDSRAPLRDSGIPWLGQIPAHWQTRRVALLFRERDERGEPELPLLEVSINAGVMLREFSDDRIESTAADFNTYKVARRGDIVFNKMRMWQGAVGVAPEDGLVSPDYTVAEPLGSLSSAYAGQLFRTEMFSAECARNSHGIVWDRLRLYWDGFRDIALPLPSLEEQDAIVARIVTETAKLDALRAATERTIALLKERRAALIAAAVTGRIAISGNAAENGLGGEHEN
ncbi:MAG: restriction endonuclease subunit S [Blastocatellales bacterium]